MEYIELAKNQKITLVQKKGATPTQAIHSAIEFCKKHQCKECYLEYKGFTFGIEPDSDIKKLLDDYKYGKDY